MSFPDKPPEQDSQYGFMTVKISANQSERPGSLHPWDYLALDTFHDFVPRSPVAPDARGYRIIPLAAGKVLAELRDEPKFLRPIPCTPTQPETTYTSQGYSSSVLIELHLSHPFRLSFLHHKYPNPQNTLVLKGSSIHPVPHHTIHLYHYRY